MSDTRVFLRDLLKLLGLPALVLGGLLALWRPWNQLPWTTHPVSEPIFEARDSLERRARGNHVREVVWEGLEIQVPVDMVLTVDEAVLEAMEQYPSRRSESGEWPAKMAFLVIDSAATSRFADAASNCDLAPGRCWEEPVGSYHLTCHRSAGVPDPDIPWTPHIECQEQRLGLRVLINVPQQREDALLAIFRDALLRPHQTP